MNVVSSTYKCLDEMVAVAVVAMLQSSVCTARPAWEESCDCGAQKIKAGKAGSIGRYFMQPRMAKRQQRKNATPATHYPVARPEATQLQQQHSDAATWQWRKMLAQGYWFQ